MRLKNIIISILAILFIGIVQISYAQIDLSNSQIGANGTNGLNGSNSLNLTNSSHANKNNPNGINGLNNLNEQNVMSGVNGAFGNDAKSQGVMSGVNAANDTYGLNRLQAQNGSNFQAGILHSSNLQPANQSLISDSMILDCKKIALQLGGKPVSNGKVCDVIVIRHNPQILSMNKINLNQFSLMNSVIEFVTSHNTLSNNSTQVYAMGDFALLETEMNDVLSVVTNNGWTVTGIHNHMINETPKTIMMHWEVQGNINKIIDQANEAFAKTAIKS